MPESLACLECLSSDNNIKWLNKMFTSNAVEKIIFVK